MICFWIDVYVRLTGTCWRMATVLWLSLIPFCEQNLIGHWAPNFLVGLGERPQTTKLIRCLRSGYNQAFTEMHVVYNAICFHCFFPKYSGWPGWQTFPAVSNKFNCLARLSIAVQWFGDGSLPVFRNGNRSLSHRMEDTGSLANMLCRAAFGAGKVLLRCQVYHTFWKPMQEGSDHGSAL